MRTTILFVSLAVVPLTLPPAEAQGRGRNQGRSQGMMSNPATIRSNAPLGTPHASIDRDKGRDRAADAGRGKKSGLTKQNSRKHSRRR